LRFWERMYSFEASWYSLDMDGTGSGAGMSTA